MGSIDAALLRLLTVWRARLAGDDGQTLAEYSIIVTVIAVGVVVLGMIVFREELAAAFNAASGCLDGSC